MPGSKVEHRDVRTTSGKLWENAASQASQTPPGLGCGNVHLTIAPGGSEAAPLWTDLGIPGLPFMKVLCPPH